MQGRGDKARIVGCARGTSMKFYNCRECLQLSEATAFTMLDQALRFGVQHCLVP
jgi:hypothetical protein